MWDLFQTPFKGFVASDFGAYTEDKWSSRLHNRARMGVRDKLSALGRQAREALEAQGASFSVEANDAQPSVFNGQKVDAQWLFLTRTEADRKQLATLIDREVSVREALEDAGHHKRHLMLGIKVHQGGVDVMLGLHRRAIIDVRNSLSKLGDEVAAEDFQGVMADVSASSAGQLHLVAPTGVTPMHDVDAVTLQAALTALSQGQGDWCLFGRNFPADSAEPRDEGFGAFVADLFVDLLPLYNFLLWRQDNDHLALRHEIKEREVQARLGGAAELQVGDAVVITSGLFSGKAGTVQEIDQHGMTRVAVGKLVVQIKGDALRRQ